jgi:hypothetical protein
VRPRVIYTGEFKATDPLVIEHLEIWWKAMDRGPSRVANYGESMKVIESGTARWVAVQDKLIGSMRTELKPGDAIDLFALYLGSVGKHVDRRDQLIPVVLINEFCGCQWQAETAKETE